MQSEVVPSTAPASPVADHQPDRSDEAVVALRRSLEAAAVPQRAPEMSRYMKDRFVFLGVRSPQRRVAQREFVAGAAAAGTAESLRLAAALWEEPEREFQYVAVDLLRRVAKRLPATSLVEVRRLVATKSWWDTVDALAKVLGCIVAEHPEVADQLDDWVTNDDIWVARAAILHQLGWLDRARPDVVFRYCEARIDHTDFFIRKAIGWALRDLARTFPEQVWAWVDAHPGLSGLSRREATKHRTG